MESAGPRSAGFDLARDDATAPGSATAGPAPGRADAAVPDSPGPGQARTDRADGPLMSLERLRVLRELADRGTVAAVAEALSMTPSAVSQQLKVLAREAGVALLEPDGRRVRLTDAGRALVVRADEVLEAMERAVSEMAEYRGSPRGRVRVALFPSGATLLLPHVLAELEDSGVEVVAADEDVPPSEVQRLLADYDLVLTHRDERSPSLGGPRVSSRVLMREPIDVVVAPGHRLARQGAVVPAELADETWISVRTGFPVDDVLRSIATVTGVQPRIAQRLNEFSVIEALVAADYGVALMPRYAVRHPDLVMLRLAGVRAARVYDLATRTHADKRPAVAMVIAAFQTAARRATGLE
ncbi:LysR family transcriptional regulator [Nocardia seriolae]|nr:LysR family transcriptional regulator [Nocardia seriolae]